MEKAFLFYCRPGFEKDVIAELTALVESSENPAHGLCSPIFRTKADTGWVHATFQQPESSTIGALPFSKMIFVRQQVEVGSKLTELPEQDRATPIAESMLHFLKQNFSSFSALELEVESADSEIGNTLQPFCRAITSPLKAKLSKLGIRFEKSASYRLHVFFENYTEAWIGVSHIDNSSPHSRGIPRLKFPSGAPSRSTLKLDEAFLVLLSKHESSTRLKKGMSAVDLGACPGGWTFQLVQRGINVIAVDHGKLDKNLEKNPLVRYEAANGLKYIPPKTVDWMVCDMIETPTRVTTVALNWLLKDYCKNCVVTLKLPMKSRYSEVTRCLSDLDAGLNSMGIECELRVRQLYHNREEVTLLVLRR